MRDRRHPSYKTYQARTKAGRAWIEKILDCAASDVEKVEIDLVSDQVEKSTIPLTLLRQFIGIDGKDAALYEVSDCQFVYLTSGSLFGHTKYVIRTYAFDPTDLPEIK